MGIRLAGARALPWLLLVAGCSPPEHLLWEAAPLHRGAGGGVEVGKVVGPVLAPTGTGVLVKHEGKSVTVRLKAIGPDKAMFAATFPDGAVVPAEVAFGQSQDLFPSGQEVGFRIRVYGKRQPVAVPPAAKTAP
jgi:hypothetical protein